MKPWLLCAAVCVSSLSGASAIARADASARTLSQLVGVQQACRRAERPGRRVLYEIVVPREGYRFGSYIGTEGFLAIDSRRNLRALGGAVELFTSGLEPMGFVATSARVDALVAAREEGASLRVGFFLGFDDPRRRACLIRAAQAVSTVRMDLAYLELVDTHGQVIAREESERLRAWLDDDEAVVVPGRGPRGVVAGVTLAREGTTAPDVVRRVFIDATPELSAALAACHRAGVQRGAEAQGEVMVRLDVDARGVVTEAQVELSSIGDAEDAECIAHGLRNAVRFSPEARARGEMSLSVTVRVAADGEDR